MQGFLLGIPVRSVFALEMVVNPANLLVNEKSPRDCIKEKLDYFVSGGLQTISFSHVNLQCKNKMKDIVRRLESQLVTKLTLTGCSLDAVSIAMLKPVLHNIHTLDLSFNLFGSAGAISLARVLTNSNIVSLKVGNNQLCGVVAIRSKVYGVVDISGLEALLQALLTCRCLSTLDLSNNYLGGFNVARTINDESADENYGPQVIHMLKEFLTFHPSLTEVNLVGNRFSSSGSIEGLVKCITRDSALSSLCGRLSRLKETNVLYADAGYDNTDPIPYYDFHSCDLDASSGCFLGHELICDRKLCVLDLSDNLKFGTEGMHCLMAQFFASSGGADRPQQSTMLETCILTRTGQLSAFPLCALCTISDHLRLLNISENNLGDDEMIALFRCLTRHPSIKTLITKEVYMTEIAMPALRELLSSNQVLESVDISDNTIGDTGIALLLQNHVFQPTFKRLVLHNVQLSTAACNALAREFKVSDSLSLVDIDISSNHEICGSRSDQSFDPAPIVALADGLSANRHVRILNLSGNDIGARATQRLMEGLKISLQLHSINLRKCHLSDHGAAHLAEALPVLKGLKWLDVSECLLGPAGCESLFTGLATNKTLLYLNAAQNQLSGGLLSHNGASLLTIEENAMTCLFNCIKQNNTLQYLGLDNNSLFGVPSFPAIPYSASEFVLAGLIESLTVNKTLRTLQLLGNSILVQPSISESQDILVKLTTELGGILRWHPSLRSFCGLVYPRGAANFDRRTYYPEFHNLQINQPQFPLRGGDLKSTGAVTLESVEDYMSEKTVILQHNASQQISKPAWKHVLCSRMEVHNCSASESSVSAVDLMVNLVQAEISDNHYVTELVVSDQLWAERLGKAIKKNMVLKRFIYPPPSLLSAVRTSDLTAAKLQSLLARVGLAIFLRHFGSTALSSSLRLILEYTVGPGPLIASLLSRYALYPSVLTASKPSPATAKILSSSSSSSLLSTSTSAATESPSTSSTQSVVLLPNTPNPLEALVTPRTRVVRNVTSVTYDRLSTRPAEVELVPTLELLSDVRKKRRRMGQYITPSVYHFNL